MWKEQPSSNCFVSSQCWYLCGSSKDFFLTVGSCVEETRLLFLLLVLVWQQQDFSSYYWFLCDNNNVSFDYFHAWAVGLVRCWVGL